jgi:protease-4
MSNSILLIETDEMIHELGETNSLAAFSGEVSYSPGLYDILKAIEHAKTDKNIEGIMIRVSNTPNGWATLQQMREALISFKGSKKFIYAYGEMIPQKSFYLASVADSIFLNPMGFAEFKGLSSELPFFKGTLQKLELQPEIFYAGKFKSATEPFREEKMSEPNRQQIAGLQADFWNEFLLAVAGHTKTDTASLHQLAVSGSVLFPEDALKHKLVDRLLYVDQVEHLLRAKTERKEEDKIRYVSMDEYVNEVRKKRKTAETRIAVLLAEGGITDGEKSDDYEIASADFIEEIRKVRTNDKIKAVVLRVNSPGGSALASEVILRELQLLKQKKPLIVSMGDVAASGGYYIACQADSIFALPTTITGSIGVFAMLFNSENLFKNKLGVTFDQVKNAPYADFPTATRALNQAESQKMQATVDTIYSIFKRRVAAGRKMNVALVDSFAQGRVWTGTDALQIGLVDGLGGLDRAIESAAKKAGVKDYYVVTYPEPLDKFQSFMRRFKGSSVSAEVIKAAMESEVGAEFRFYKDIRALQRMNGTAQAAMPFRLDIR